MAITDLAGPTTATPAAAATAAATSTSPALPPGTKVEVRRTLDGKWAQGFEVIEAAGDGYRLRRLSDGVELPVAMPAGDVRRHRKRDYWWY